MHIEVMLLLSVFILGCQNEDNMANSEFNYGGIPPIKIEQIQVSDTISVDTYTIHDSHDIMNYYIKERFRVPPDSEETIISHCIFDSSAYPTPRLHRLTLNECYFKTNTEILSQTFKQGMSVLGSTLKDFDYLMNNFDSNLIIHYCCIDNLRFFRNFFNSIEIYQCYIKHNLTLSENNFTLNDDFKIISCLLPDTIRFFSVKCIKEIDLTNNVFSNHISRPILIYFQDCDITKFKIDYIHFKLGFFSGCSTEDKEKSYEILLNNFKTSGQLESYRLLDIEYQDFKYKSHWYSWPLSWINKFWWNYGYTKSMVFFWTAVFLLIFTPITYIKLNYLNHEVYQMKNIPKMYPTTKKSVKWWYSFIYTSSIFFRLTLKLDDVKFQHRSWTIYILLVYTLGIICLAYMANFVLQK